MECTAGSVLTYVIDEEAEARAIAQARAEIAAGKGIPHEVAREWLAKLAKGENVPPPSA